MDFPPQSIYLRNPLIDMPEICPWVILDPVRLTIFIIIGDETASVVSHVMGK